MSQELNRSAILSGAMRFVTAGGLSLAIALAQEVAKSDRDWALVLTMAAGLLAGMAGGAYRRINAAGPAAPPRSGREVSSCPCRAAS